PAGILPNMAADGEEQVSGVRFQVSGLRRANLDNTVDAPGTRHSRESGNPSSCAPTWTPAYAGVTTRDENTKMKERSLNVIENNSRCQVPEERVPGAGFQVSHAGVGDWGLGAGRKSSDE